MREAFEDNGRLRAPTASDGAISSFIIFIYFSSEDTEQQFKKCDRNALSQSSWIRRYDYECYVVLLSLLDCIRLIRTTSSDDTLAGTTPNPPDFSEAR